MSRFTKLLPVLALGLVFSGCGREERTAREELASAAQEDPGFRTDEPAAVVQVPDTAGGRTLTGNLGEMGGSGASGVVTVTPQNGRTLIQLSVTGAQPNTTLRPTIHRGRCDEPGQRVHMLEPMTVEATGLAVANPTIDQRVESIADGSHSVRIYPEAGLDVAPIACAELPAAAAAPTPF